MSTTGLTAEDERSRLKMENTGTKQGDRKCQQIPRASQAIRGVQISPRPATGQMVRRVISQEMYISGTSLIPFR